jgi:hypothetical protein
MNRFNLSICVLGAFHVSLWAWAPVVVRWQTRNALEHYNSIESLEIAMQVFQESMLHAYISAGVVGALMLLAAALIYKHRLLGWRLWIASLVVCVAGAVITISVNGASVGAIFRLLLIATFAYYVSLRIYQSTMWLTWFDRVAST